MYQIGVIHISLTQSTLMCPDTALNEAEESFRQELNLMKPRKFVTKMTLNGENNIQKEQLFPI